jgi:hypothetical protein
METMNHINKREYIQNLFENYYDAIDYHDTILCCDKKNINIYYKNKNNNYCKSDMCWGKNKYFIKKLKDICKGILNENLLEYNELIPIYKQWLDFKHDYVFGNAYKYDKETRDYYSFAFHPMDKNESYPHYPDDITEKYCISDDTPIYKKLKELQTQITETLKAIDF